MKADKVFIPVSVDERLPTEEKNYHTSVGIVKYQIAPPKLSLKSGWQYGSCPSYWLEKKENVYVFTMEEIKALVTSLTHNGMCCQPNNIDAFIADYFNKQFPTTTG